MSTELICILTNILYRALMANLKVSRLKIYTRGFRKIEFITHTLFYAIRIVILMIFYSLAFRSFHLLNTPSTNGIIVNISYNIYLFYFVIKSILTSNIYEYCVAASIMLNNCFLLLIAVIFILKHLDSKYILLTCACALSYALEFCISILFILKRREENNRTLFQKIGADSNINNAYATRTQLQTFGSLNIFISANLLQLSYSPNSKPANEVKYGDLVIFIMSILENISAYTLINEENKKQRKIAIWISFIKLGFVIASIVFAVLRYNKTPYNIESIRVILNIDEFIITIIMITLLIKDQKNFGIGLKKHFECKARRLKL